MLLNVLHVFGPNVYENNYHFEIDVFQWSVGTRTSLAFFLKAKGLHSEKRVPKQHPQGHYLAVHNLAPLGVLFWYRQRGPFFDKHDY